MSLTRTLLAGVLLVMFPLQVIGWDWRTKVTVVVKDVPLSEICLLLDKKYGIHFSYSRNIVNLSHKVTVAAYDRPLKKFLEELFTPHDITFTRIGDQVVLTIRQEAPRTISGYVEDATSGERLIGATVYSPGLKVGTTTNQFGFFSLTTPKDSGNLLVSYIGYQQQLLSVPASGPRMVNVALQPLGSLPEVVITEQSQTHLQDQTQMSKVNIPMSDVRSMPKLLGEADVMRTLQSIPGVSGGVEGVSGMYVRGGGPDQNLVLMDGTPIFYFSHFFGVYSLLNPDIVKCTDLYKGDFPARYGGRLSSVVDIALKDGDMKKFHGDVSIGLIAAKFSLEGPIKKDKTSFILSARRSYPDLLLNAIATNDNNINGRFSIYFYDVNAKVNHIFSPKDRIYFSFYGGQDHISLRGKSQQNNDSMPITGEAGRFKLGWGNLAGSLRWNHIYSPQLFSNTTVHYSRFYFLSDFGYKYRIPATNENGDQFGKYLSRMQTASVRTDFDYRPDPRHSIRLGGMFTAHLFKPVESVFTDRGSNINPLDTGQLSINKNGAEVILFAEDEWTVRPDLFVHAGVHASAFFVEGRLYYSIQPRLGVRYVLPHNWALKGAYTHMNQYVHLLSTGTTTLPTDIWVPSTQRVPPMFSRQMALGIARTSNDNKYEFSLEGYFKTMDNLIEYKSQNTYFRDASNWDEVVALGTGRSYGGELLIRKKSGKTTGMIGYTLSYSDRQFPDINDGRRFPYRYDRRHDLELILTQQLGKHWEFTAGWRFTTGAPITLPVSSYEGIDNGSPHEPSPWTAPFGDPRHVDRYGNRHNYRTDNVHRLDIGITYTKQKKWWKKSWNLSVFNVYNQKNPFFYYLKEDHITEERYLSKVTILPILPSVTYSIKF